MCIYNSLPKIHDTVVPPSEYLSRATVYKQQVGQVLAMLLKTCQRLLWLAKIIPAQTVGLLIVDRY